MSEASHGENKTTLDALTGCLTFYAFKSSVTQILSHFDGSEKYALLYIDIKGFKYFNDMLGYQGGDEILKYIASLMLANIEGTDVVARVSGDVFVTFRRYSDFDEVLMRFSYFSHQLKNYYTQKMIPLRIEALAGIYLVESVSDILSVSEMIDRANLAHRTLREKPGTNVALYDKQMRDEYLWQREVESYMYQALASGEFEVYFQPQIDIQDRNILAGAEALIRWNHPEKGIIPPDLFVPIFERNGFIIHLDEFVLRKVCELQAEFMHCGKRLFPIAVNVSQYDLFHPDFVQRYIAIKNDFGIPDYLIELEFTETVVFNDHERFGEIIRQVKRNGFLCALDDFGSGNSSLNILKDLPVDVLKIDKQFFVPSDTPEKDNAIIFSVIAMSRALKMRTVSEGIEDTSMLPFLRKIGCNYIQGYVFSHPLPWNEFKKLVLETDASFMEPLPVLSINHALDNDCGYISAKYRFLTGFFEGLIIDLDFEQDRYVIERRAGVDKLFDNLSLSGNYSEFLKNSLIARVNQDDADKIAVAMSIETIRNTFFSNVEHIAIEFSMMSADAKPLQLRMTAQRIVLQDYQRFAGVIFIQDITGRKNISTQQYMQEHERDLLDVFMNALHWNTYIINAETFEILYSNDAVRKWFPTMLPGSVCYHSFASRLSPCPQCPINALRITSGGVQESTKMYLTIEDKSVLCSISPIKLSICDTAIMLSFNTENLGIRS